MSDRVKQTIEALLNFFISLIIKKILLLYTKKTLLTKKCHIDDSYIYNRFIVRFPIGLDFPS